jgi:hypothetical protein
MYSYPSVGEVVGAGHAEVAVVEVQHAEPAAFRGDVEPVGVLVIGQDVGILSDGVRAGDLPGGQVNGEQGGVAVAGEERKPVARIQGQPVLCWQPGNGTRAVTVSVAGSMIASWLWPCTATSI